MRYRIGACCSFWRKVIARYSVTLKHILESDEAWPTKQKRLSKKENLLKPKEFKKRKCPRAEKGILPLKWSVPFRRVFHSEVQRGPSSLLASSSEDVVIANHKDFLLETIKVTFSISPWGLFRLKHFQKDFKFCKF